MAFSKEVAEKAFDNAGGVCECARTSHKNHPGKECGKTLSKENQGRETGWGAWEAHHKDGNPDNNELSNCEVLCWECHKQTL